MEFANLSSSMKFGKQARNTKQYILYILHIYHIMFQLSIEKHMAGAMDEDLVDSQTGWVDK